jgi:hypothetical protein
MQSVNIISIVLQSIIAVFLIWYTIETYKLRKQTAFQNRISIQPIIDFIHDAESPAGVFTLENVGSGAALNLHLYVWMSDESQLLALPKGQRPSIIRPNQRIRTGQLKSVDSSAIKKNHPKLARLVSNMPSIPGIGSFVAAYEDTAGNLYYSHQYADLTLPDPFSFGPL